MQRSPPSTTCANAPPAHLAYIAALSPGTTSSMRSQGFVSPPIRRTTDPTRRRRLRESASAIPETIRFARRLAGEAAPPTSFISRSHTSRSIIVTCRVRLLSAEPARPRSATARAVSRASIGPRWARFVQIASSFPGTVLLSLPHFRRDLLLLVTPMRNR
jgi:hypothetical protein